MFSTHQNLDPALARRLADMEAIIQRIPGVSAPIKKSAESCYADSPFVDKIALVEMPRKFIFPHMKRFDGVSDLDDHIAQYRQRMFTVAIPRDMREYASSRKLEKISEDLYAIVQRHDEPLRDYIGRFNKEKVSITNCSEQTAVTTFRKGLLLGSDLYKTLTKYPCKTMEDMLIQAWAQIKWEEDQYNRQRVFPPERPERDYRVDRRSGRDSRDRRTEPYTPQRGNKGRRDYDQAPSTRPRERAKLPEYLLSISPVEAVTALMNLGDKVRWLEKMRAPPDQRDRSKWCDFHSDHGHHTDVCIALRLEVANLLKKGHLTDHLTDKGRQTLQQARKRTEKHRDDAPPSPPHHEITVNVIFGGSEVSGVTHSAAKRHTRQARSSKSGTSGKVGPTDPTLTISFAASESDKLLHPHHDA
ncbi:uncharacterized protein LOC130994173 [Salvia miltiorrhiza]|uniref:uncharacterized protein LOC130994173 n=1 Tax=Salvia miltiorrhiza TaxID=226208 RepID=UPI0025AC8596|nr:uncharacterized protein LOC130994173 [Salvia miltiorrhiza]